MISIEERKVKMSAKKGSEGQLEKYRGIIGVQLKPVKRAMALRAL